MLLNGDVYRPSKMFRGLIPDEHAFGRGDSADLENSENRDGSDGSDESDVEDMIALFPH